jgi:hypothetical protein
MEKIRQKVKVKIKNQGNSFPSIILIRINFNYAIWFAINNFFNHWLFLGSCEEPAIKIERLDKGHEAITRDIPQSEQNKSTRDRNYKLMNALALKTLENGFDGLQIRIWRGYPNKDTGQLFILTNKNSTWSAELIRFNYFFFEKGASIGKRSAFRDPASGWNSFTRKLFKLDITTLPDFHSLPGYDLPTHSDGVEVEYANGNSYRMYTYAVPDMYMHDIPEAGKVVQILELIEREFDFKGFVKQ